MVCSVRSVICVKAVFAVFNVEVGACHASFRNLGIKLGGFLAFIRFKWDRLAGVATSLLNRPTHNICPLGIALDSRASSEQIFVNSILIILILIFPHEKIVS